MKKGFLLLAFAAFGFVSANAQMNQPHVCGNAADQAHIMPRLRENKVAMEAARATAEERGGTQYVPIHFHLVANAAGTGRHPEIKVMEQLCALNAEYLPVGIQFYLKEHPTYGLFDKSISNDNVYSNQSNALLMNLRRHQNAMNVFVVDEPVSGNNNPGIVLAYYSPTQDWIVSRKTETNGNQPNSTLPHEVGHFFSLPHTFYGYEPNPFDSADPSWPNAPVMAPAGGGITTERQNGTNCATAADEICDTPPDYNFGLINPLTSCVYTGGAHDPLGVLVNPMENNFMGYFNSCDYAFTQDQIDIMNADLNGSTRNYLDNTFSPVATEITTPTDLLIAPIGGAVAQHYNNVLLEWKSTPGATHYLLEIDIIPSFSTANAQIFYETGASKLLTNLLPNKTYYWRVKPFNMMVGCAAARNSNFKTSGAGVSTVEIEGLTAWQLSPNPVRGASANLSVNAEKGFEANVRISDATGRTLSLQTGVQFPQGETNYEISTESLVNGLYFVSLESGNGRNVRKLSVLK